MHQNKQNKKKRIVFYFFFLDVVLFFRKFAHVNFNQSHTYNV